MVNFSQMHFSVLWVFVQTDFVRNAFGLMYLMLGFDYVIETVIQYAKRFCH